MLGLCMALAFDIARRSDAVLYSSPGNLALTHAIWDQKSAEERLGTLFFVRPDHYGGRSMEQLMIPHLSAVGCEAFPN